MINSKDFQLYSNKTRGYSLINEKKIKNDIAITGEINLQGNITMIGGLDSKIKGGIRAGVKHFLYPKDNEHDFNIFVETNGLPENIRFNSVARIEETFKFIYE